MTRTIGRIALSLLLSVWPGSLVMTLNARVR